MTQHQFNWTEGKLAQGFDSYAAHMGIAPAKAVFINSLVVNPTGPTWRMTATDDLEGLSTAYVLALSGPGSTALHFPLSPLHQTYVSEYLTEGGKLQAITPLTEGRVYPEASIISALLSTAQTLAVQDMLRGKVIINSYVSEEVEALALNTGAETLMSNATFLKFVGKEYLHQVAGSAGFNVPPGVVMYQPDTIPTVQAALELVLQGHKLDPETTKVWVKPTSLSGGQGLNNIKGISAENVAGAFMTVAQAYQDCGFYGDAPAALNLTAPFNGIQRFMPVVMEVDAAWLPGVKKKLDDVGISAIISDKGVTFIEATPFDAPDGEYSGSHLAQPEDEARLYPAKVAADKLFKRMWQDGYRGFLGVDAILVEQNDGSTKAYLNDVNTRLTGATPLIGLAHKTEAHTGKQPHACLMKTQLPLPEGCTDAFAVVAEHLGDKLYKGAASGYLGVVPTLIDVPPDKGYITLKTVALAASAEQLASLKKAIAYTPAP